MSTVYMSPSEGQARVYRDPRRGWIAGVCAGLAQSLGVTPCFVRCLAVIAFVFANLWAVAAYVVAALLLPKREQPASECEARARGRETLDPDAEARYTQAAEADLERLRNRFRDMEDRLRGMEAHVTSRERTLDEELRRL